MSTLDNAEEIELRFYYLKSIEWGISQDEAKSLIEDKMRDLSAYLRDKVASGTD